MEKWLTPIEAAQLPTAQSVLVLAPHPDDEIFGCGGALALYAQQSSVAVHVHILTDGAGYAEADQREAIFAVRKKESIQALEDISPRITVDFGNFADRSLSQSSALVAHVQQLLVQHQPQVVLLPSPWEVHPDHLAVSRAAWAAVLLQSQGALRSSSEASLLFYEIGNPLKANLLVDITSVWHQKMAAMQRFSSQQQVQDYARHIAGLNNYRTYTLPAQVHQAEAYHCVSSIDMARAACVSSDDMHAISVDAVGALCMNRWLETVLHNASVHAEDLQRSLIEVSRQLQRSTAELHEKNMDWQSRYERACAESNRLAQQHQQNAAQREQQWVQRENVLLQSLAAAEQRANTLLADQEQMRQQHTDQLQNLFNSTSWRVTQPLRWLRQLFQKNV